MQIHLIVIIWLLITTGNVTIDWDIIKCFATFLKHGFVPVCVSVGLSFASFAITTFSMLTTACKSISVLLPRSFFRWPSLFVATL